MLFIDASVAVAIITRKEEADALMDRLEKEGGPFYVSAVMKVEASISIARRLAGPGKPATSDMVATARRLVNQFTADLEARDVPIANDVANKALDAGNSSARSSTMQPASTWAIVSLTPARQQARPGSPTRATISSIPISVGDHLPLMGSLPFTLNRR